MGKYDALHDFLMDLPAQESEKTLTFRAIEEIIHAELPPSAHRWQAWWGNETGWENRPQAAAWMLTGWRVDAVDQVKKWVRFRRGG